MSVPTSYTDETLATYMSTIVGDIATILKWTNPASYAEPLTDVLHAYGVSTIAEATDMPRIRAIARREVWRFAMQRLSGAIDFTADGASFSRSKLYDHAKAMFEQAASDVASIDAVTAIDTSSTSGIGTSFAPNVAVW